MSSGFPCPSKKGCPGTCRPQAVDGRFYEHRGVWINIPASFVIPKCDVCSQDALDEELYVALIGLMEIEYQRHGKLIKQIKARAKAIQ